ncbi:MAG: ABC transporter substrate-binding protein [Clostridia bacterium]|nr:ABC transporter substrate-binding protein [Clostridia bacterium]
MKKRLMAVWMALLMLFVCPAQAEESRWPYTFADSTGASVTLTHMPQTVAVLFSSYAEIWQLAGGQTAITVGESVERGFAAEDAVLVDSGAGKAIDHELLLAAQPDLIIGSADIPAHVQAKQALQISGIPFALFRVDTFEDYLSMLETCTGITGRADAYETHGAAVQRQVDAVKAAVRALDEEPKTILFIRAGSQYSATKAKRAPDHFACIMLDELGSRNIADDARVLLDGLSLEDPPAGSGVHLPDHHGQRGRCQKLYQRPVCASRLERPDRRAKRGLRLFAQGTVSLQTKRQMGGGLCHAGRASVSGVENQWRKPIDIFPSGGCWAC